MRWCPRPRSVPDRGCPRRSGRPLAPLASRASALAASKSSPASTTRAPMARMRAIFNGFACLRRVDGQRHAAGAAGVGHGLTEIAGGGAHQRGPGRQVLHQPVGAPPLEGADGIERLGLQRDASAELLAERLADPLRGVEEDRVDGPRRRLDPLEGDAPALVGDAIDAVIDDRVPFATGAPAATKACRAYSSVIALPGIAYFGRHERVQVARLRRYPVDRTQPISRARCTDKMDALLRSMTR